MPAINKLVTSRNQLSGVNHHKMVVAYMHQLSRCAFNVYISEGHKMVQPTSEQVR